MSRRKRSVEKRSTKKPSTVKVVGPLRVVRPVKVKLVGPLRVVRPVKVKLVGPLRVVRKVEVEVVGPLRVVRPVKASQSKRAASSDAAHPGRRASDSANSRGAKKPHKRPARSVGSSVGRGRRRRTPEPTRHLSVYLPHELVERLDRAADLRGASRSDLLDLAVRAYLAEHYPRLAPRPAPTVLDALARARELRRNGLSLAEVAAQLNREGHHTRRGASWSAENLRARLKR